MDCATVRTELAAYVAGDLPEDLEALIRTHLEVCPACRCLCKEYEDLDIVLREWQPPSLSEGFAAGVRQRVPWRSGDILVIDFDDEKPSFWGSWWSRAAVVGIAAGLIGMLVWLASPPAQSPPQQNMDQLIAQVGQRVTEHFGHYVVSSKPGKIPLFLMIGVVPTDVAASEAVSPDILPMAASALMNSGALLTAAGAIP